MLALTAMVSVVAVLTFVATKHFLNLPLSLIQTTLPPGEDGGGEVGEVAAVAGEVS